MRLPDLTIYLATCIALASFSSGCSLNPANLGPGRFVNTVKSKFLTTSKRREFRSTQRQSRSEAIVSDLESRYNTVPEVEADLGLRLRQRFEMGEPELDIAKAREVLNSAILEHENRLLMYQDQIVQWEAARVQFLATNTSGVCYPVPRPTKPDLSVMASEVPMKISLRIGTKIDRPNVTGFRTRQVVDDRAVSTQPPVSTSLIAPTTFSEHNGFSSSLTKGTNGVSEREATGMDAPLGEKNTKREILTYSEASGGKRHGDSSHRRVRNLKTTVENNKYVIGGSKSIPIIP